MDFGYLFTSFEGRISRKPYWISILIMVAIVIVLSIVLAFVLGGGGGVMLQIAILVVLAYPATALMVKRLHDRDRPSILVAVFWAPSVLSLLGQATGISGTMSDVYGTPVFQPNMLGWIIMGLGLVVGIWALVELGILRGTAGPNQYGPDPLEQ